MADVGAPGISMEAPGGSLGLLRPSIAAGSPVNPLGGQYSRGNPLRPQAAAEPARHIQAPAAGPHIIDQDHLLPPEGPTESPPRPEASASSLAACRGCADLGWHPSSAQAPHIRPPRDPGDRQGDHSRMEESPVQATQRRRGNRHDQGRSPTGQGEVQFHAEVFTQYLKGQRPPSVLRSGDERPQAVVVVPKRDCSCGRHALAPALPTRRKWIRRCRQDHRTPFARNASRRGFMRRVLERSNHEPSHLNDSRARSSKQLFAEEPPETPAIVTKPIHARFLNTALNANVSAHRGAAASAALPPPP